MKEKLARKSYCLAFTGSPTSVSCLDHHIPQSLGGSTGHLKMESSPSDDKGSTVTSAEILLCSGLSKAAIQVESSGDLILKS